MRRLACAGALLALAGTACSSPAPRDGASATTPSASATRSTSPGTQPSAGTSASSGATGTVPGGGTGSAAPAATSGTAASSRPAPPVPGTYTYGLSVDGRPEETVRVVVEAGRSEGAGRTSFRTRTDYARNTVFSTVVWSADGAVTTRNDTDGPQGRTTSVCTPPTRDLAFPLVRGAGWAYQGRCELRSGAAVTRSEQRTTYRCAGDGTVDLSGRAEPAWLIDESNRTTLRGDAPNAVPATSTTTSRRSLLKAYRMPGLVVSTTNDTGPDGKPRTVRTRLVLRAVVPA